MSNQNMLDTIRIWEEEGILRWMGRQDDVRPFISKANCVVLPSYYREGTPRTLLEAASMAKSLIAADSIGTREPLDDGISGYLCRPRDAEDLADKMERIINMGRESREQMGWRGRVVVTTEN
jgi:glycosyltransferase involved in cell wall biosynthesis